MGMLIARKCQFQCPEKSLRIRASPNAMFLMDRMRTGCEEVRQARTASAGHGSLLSLCVHCTWLNPQPLILEYYSHQNKLKGNKNNKRGYKTKINYYLFQLSLYKQSLISLLEATAKQGRTQNVFEARFLGSLFWIEFVLLGKHTFGGWRG